jgi:hypothetical protein
MLNRKFVATILCLSAVLFLGAERSQAQPITITGTVGSSGKYLLSGSPVKTTTHAVLKISFETTTPGRNLSLCAGTTADFEAGNCATELSGSGGPGFTFLTIVDAADLNGLQLFVKLNVGSAPASFTVSID